MDHLQPSSAAHGQGKLYIVCGGTYLHISRQTDRQIERQTDTHMYIYGAKERQSDRDGAMNELGRIDNLLIVVVKRKSNVFESNPKPPCHFLHV